MRQRRIKDLDARLEALKDLQIKNPEEYKGKWSEFFKEYRGDFKGREIFLEIGCGKGNFICQLAQLNPKDNFIAIEVQPSVVVKAMEKAREEKIDNLIFLPIHLKDIRDIFDRELSGIYLNFSDPWHKKRHSKRRLTHRNFLQRYREVLKDGFIKMKTDNDKLFNFTLDEIGDVGQTMNLEIEQVSRDLHVSPYCKGNIMTEYEEKFSSRGKNINYIKFTYKS